MTDTPVPPPTAPAKKSFWERIKTSRFLFVSILFHVVLFLVAGVLVVQVVTKRKQTFTAAPPAPENRAVEHKVQMAKKQQAMAAPMTKRVVTTGLSKVALPEMPEIASPTDVASLSPSMAPGVGVGPSMLGGSDSGAGGAPFFGFRDPRGSALEGTFYDLKQSRAGKPTQKWSENSYRAVIGKYARLNLTDSVLTTYYRGKNKLYAPQIMMPSIPADAGPKGFGVDKEVAPSYWLAVYKGKVSPPHSGVIHFVGAADDVILVKFNGRLVLDGSLYHGLGEWKAKQEYNYDNWTRNTLLKNRDTGGWARSEGIKVEAGQWYDLVVAIGEAPGGFFDASLLIEEEGVTYAKDARGNPILPPFRLSNVKVAKPEKERSLPPFATDGPIWKSQAPAGGLGLLNEN